MVAHIIARAVWQDYSPTWERLPGTWRGGSIPR